MSKGEFFKVKVLKGIDSYAKLSERLNGNVDKARVLALIDEINEPYRRKAETTDDYTFIEDFTYIDGTNEGLKEDDLAMCPFGGRHFVGLVLGLDEDEPQPGITYKPIYMSVGYVR